MFRIFWKILARAIVWPFVGLFWFVVGVVFWPAYLGYTMTDEAYPGHDTFKTVIMFALELLYAIGALALIFHFGGS